ncbi:MAG: Ig-like domain-containing protein, partial [Muribaculaceae bacterium]|nr:Ig-like domain-containing protein [Muribaculaceae bacterium]
AIAVVAAIATACASIGRPEGGKRDETPPVYVSSNPAPGATKVNRQQIDIYFNENVQLEDAFNKVVVSPAQKNNARVSANGKHVKVLLQDSLKPNTTYTIDFADAIKDLNEGNVLDGFSTYFSTGDSIDTLSISGVVLQARNLEPAQGMLVGVYSNPSDTAIRTLPLERIARTNQLGQFSVLNLKPGSYSVYALNDLNRDFFWNRSEDVAFYDTRVEPRVEEIIVTDTLRSSTNQDSLVSRPGHAYFPNDLLLTWFNEDYKSLYLTDYKRPERRVITLNMSTPYDSLPEITIAKGQFEGKRAEDFAVLQKNIGLDSLKYWITDTAVMAVDSLYLSVRYMATDTTDMLTWKTDTLKFFFKDVKKKEKKKKDEEADTVPPPREHLSLKAETANSHEIYMPVVLSAAEPIDTFDISMVHLEIQVDTLWVNEPKFTVGTDSLLPMLRRNISHNWRPGAKYRLTVDSAAVVSVYGMESNAFKHEFTVKEKEKYSNLILNITGADSTAIVEILDSKDEPIRIIPAPGGKAVAEYLKPGTVYARLFLDRNGNGKWDTGNLTDSIQPEEVYYYPKKIVLKENWDVTQEWDIYATPIDMQKPYEIKKNRPKLKKGEKAPTSDDDEEEEEDDIFGDDMFGGYNDPYSNARRNNRNR